MSTVEKNKVKKKVDLLKFQQTLNNQFLEIFADKDKVDNSLDKAVDSLGLSLVFEDFQFFIPLDALKTISISNNYESSVRVKSWVFGFNQEHGEVYTVLNLEKVLNLLLNKKTDYDIVQILNDAHIAYLTGVTEDRFAFLLNNIKLEYTAEFTPLFRHVGEDRHFYWDLADGIDFSTFVKKENMSKKEFEILLKINSAIEERNRFSFSGYSEKEDLFLSLIKNVYLDSYGVKPIFLLNTNNITKCLIDVVPF